MHSKTIPAGLQKTTNERGAMQINSKLSPDGDMKGDEDPSCMLGMA
jgi:hypothetical protein